ncbi:MAG: NAD-dependent epimerase/dehydratase family protein [Bacteroides sp.]
MKVLVTGAAGFIGLHTVKALIEKGYDVVGLDCLNSYYDVSLKFDRLNELGIDHNRISDGVKISSLLHAKFHFVKLDLIDREGLASLFVNECFDAVINLAAQAGVRYSIENPYAYIDSNVVGFLNILENCRHHSISHLVYASSSSIYGLDEHVPYSESDQTDTPVSLYAATKKSNELMAHVYSHLYGLPTTGVRFFTVYGPWGRPDMAPFLFLKAILNDEPIKVFNHGNLSRDFTYIDDIIKGVVAILEKPSEKSNPYQIYNIGHSSPVSLMDFISIIERISGKSAQKEMVDMQPGDVLCTYADTHLLQQDFGYTPSVSIEDGIQHFHNWFIEYYKKSSSNL